MTLEAPDDAPAPDEEVVRRLLRAQAPHLAALPLWPAPASGSSNVVYRLGDGLAVRLPRDQEYAGDLLTEVAHLPGLGRLAAPVPEVVLAGKPDDAFPLPWAVVTWLPGAPVGELDAAAQIRLAETLGAFVASLHAVDASGMTSGPQRWGYRCGEPVTATADRWAEEAALALADLFDPAAVALAWRRLRDVPAATAAPSWVHADLSAENLLVGPDGGLVGVVDFGCMGVGDGSVDLLYAWGLCDPSAREVLREAAGADEATWLRARAWSFVGPGLLTLANYRERLPGRAARLTRQVEAAAAEVGVALR